MNRKAIDLTTELAYQTAPGVHTYGTCSAPGCTNTARGSVHCAPCVIKRLTKEVGQETAGKLAGLYIHRAAITEEINEIIEEL